MRGREEVGVRRASQSPPASPCREAGGLISAKGAPDVEAAGVSNTREWGKALKTEGWSAEAAHSKAVNPAPNPRLCLFSFSQATGKPFLAKHFLICHPYHPPEGASISKVSKLTLLLWSAFPVICFMLQLEPHQTKPICKEIQPVHPKGNQSWIFLGRTDAEAETPILCPPDAKNWLMWKDPDAGKDWRQEKGMTEDEMVRWHHRLYGHEFEWTLGVGDGQAGLVCCTPWGRKELDTTEWLNRTEIKTKLFPFGFLFFFFF